MFDVALDIARIAPSVKPPAEAKLCACAVASATKAGSEQVCDCANCCETCVPTMLNDRVRPLFSLAMFCCSMVRLATVSFVFVKATGKRKIHWSVMDDEEAGPAKSINGTVLTPDKFAAVIPNPCSAATTSSKPVPIPDCTVTEKIA